jgi:hypothetical protein
MSDFICCCIIESDGDPGNDQRMNNLASLTTAIVRTSDKHNLQDGIILLPAGYINSGNQEALSIIPDVETKIKNLLLDINNNLIMCVGIDGLKKEDGYAGDQLVLAISKSGTMAIARKFWPVANEKDKIRAAADYLSNEGEYSRKLALNQNIFYLAVCYDVFGIKRGEKGAYNNPGVNGILACIHGFSPKGQGGSGVSLFVRHGIAGASRQWNCPVYTSATYLNRKISQNWPSAVLWNQGDKSTKNWHYTDNPMRVFTKETITLPYEKIRFDIYTLG